MMTTIQVKLNERVVLFKNRLPIRALGPGRTRLWLRGLSEQRWNTDQLVFQALPEVRAVLPTDWYREVQLGEDQRGVLFREGQPVAYLRPGTHRYWTVDPSVELRVFDAKAPLPRVTDELLRVIPSGEILDAIVEPHQQGLLYVQNVFAERLPPGRYRYWRTPEAQPEVVVVDMRRRNVSIAGQELMTRDKVTLRLTLTVDYAVADPKRATEAVSDLQSTVYLAAQLAARDYVAGATLDALLEARNELTRFLDARVVPALEPLGIRVENIGVKDVILPGEMKTLLNRVIEAEKEAAANVILRREETAATRSLANTARVMAEQPILLRLKELEAMKEIAERIHEVRVVVGADGLKTLLPSELLGKG